MIPEQKLIQKLGEENLDVLVASSAQNVFYLSGLESLSQDLLSERAFAIRTADGADPHIILPGVDASIVVDMDLAYDRVFTYGSFYLYQGDTVSNADREVLRMLEEDNYDDPITALSAALETLTDGDTRVALEQAPLTADEIAQVETEVAHDELVEAGPICADLRCVKSDEEVRRLRRSVEINQASIRAAIDELESGMTEKELARVYQRNLVERGAEPLFTAIGFGSHGAYPHARPSDREIQRGEIVRFDVGCTYENYSSDIARSFAFREDNDDLAQKYEVLSESLDRGIKLLEPGVSTAEVFDGVVGYVREEGSDVFDSFDRNHVGHGIGIDVYDAPTLAQSDSTIEAGMVFCVEPPYYELGTAGLQVEDEVVVTEKGVERLSDCPDTLRVLD